MNAPIKHAGSYWGTKTDFASLMAHVEKIGPLLDKNSEDNEKLGRLNEETFEALNAGRVSRQAADQGDLAGAVETLDHVLGHSLTGIGMAHGHICRQLDAGGLEGRFV